MHSAATMWIRIDARIALVLFLLLLLSAATPVVMAWLALLPPERDPFANPREPRPKKPRDAFAILLLANVSLSVLLRVPAQQYAEGYIRKQKNGECIAWLFWPRLSWIREWVALGRQQCQPGHHHRSRR